MRLLTSQKSAPEHLNPSLREREKRRLATVIMVTTMALAMNMDMVITMDTMDMVISMALAMVTRAIESRGVGRSVESKSVGRSVGRAVRHLAGAWGKIWFMANSKQASRPCTWVTSDDPLKHRGPQ